jgi:hypothetical protein
MCPACRQNAPLIYQGMLARCAACGAPRTPLSAESVTYAGKPSRVGGLVARVFGWVVLGMGAFVALVLGSFFGWVFPDSAAPWIVGGFVSLLTLMVSLPLLFGGKKLHQDGAKKEESTRMQALFALAANRGGALRAHEAASALAVSNEEADALLTRLAKEQPDDVTLDVTEQGELVFGFPRLSPPGRSWGAGWGQRFAEIDAAGARIAPPAGQVRVVDADFEEIDEPAPARKVMRASG